MASAPVKQQRGFTLLELMITLVVTMFGLMGVMAVHLTMTSGSANAGRNSEAIAVGTQMLESLRAERPTDMMQTLTGTSTSLPPVDLTNYTTKTGRNGVSYTIDVHVAPLGVSGNLWRIRVEVKWTEDSSTASHTLPFEVIRTAQEAL
jgi:prepilin-type N-terminal cleavage/methylation domain-containing protein